VVGKEGNEFGEERGEALCIILLGLRLPVAECGYFDFIFMKKVLVFLFSQI
jgi:hypothetical protein